ncbi:hypothetical protein ACEXAJ_08850 [Fusobacterium necrophorum subsp. funduliforme]
MFLLQIFSSISISKISSSASLYGEEAIAAMGIVLRIVTLGTKDILKYELFQKRFLVNQENQAHNYQERHFQLFSLILQ